MIRTLVAVFLAGLVVGPLAGQDRTELKPLTIEHPKETLRLKYLLGMMGTFGDHGVSVGRLDPDSPLRTMSRPGVRDTSYEAEAGDLIIGVRDGFGRFVLPQSLNQFAAIVDTLPGPDTQILMADVRGSGNYIYNVRLKLAGGGGGGGGRADGAKKVVLVLIGDTNDDSVGPVVQDTLAAVERTFAEPTQKKHLRTNPYKITGSSFRRQPILDTLNAIPVGPNDALVCFVNCHGAYDPRINDYADGHFFNMPDRVNLRRRDLRQALELKNARMTCLISESCNAAGRFFIERPVQAKIAPVNEKFESLLLEAKGYVDLNSSSKGEYSFTDVFGPSFADSLSLNAFGSEKKTTWKEYTDNLAARTAACYADMRKQMLANPKASAKTKDILRGQPNQTVKVYVLPR